MPKVKAGQTRTQLNRKRKGIIVVRASNFELSEGHQFSAYRCLRNSLLSFQFSRTPLLTTLASHRDLLRITQMKIDAAASNHTRETGDPKRMTSSSGEALRFWVGEVTPQEYTRKQKRGEELFARRSDQDLPFARFIDHLSLGEHLAN